MSEHKFDRSCITAIAAVHVPEDLLAAFDASGKINKRRGMRLPHWTRDGAVYAVTFRLADSLPQTSLQSILEERKEIRSMAEQINRELSPWKLKHLEELQSDRIEKYLEAGHGECWMKRDDVAMVVQNALCHFSGKKYDLYCWCVMSNHVHVVLRPYKAFPLERVVYSWKSFTAREANKILGRRGQFWSREHYDHLIRNEAEFVHAMEYAWLNPEKAGFKNWKWRGIAPQSTAATAVIQPR